MYESPDIYDYVQQLRQYMDSQSQKMNQLEYHVQQLQTELTSLKQEKHYTVEKIEYNFDQLKVEKLEGTLIIGISPHGKGLVEEFSVNGKSKQDVQFPIHEPAYNSIQEQNPQLFEQVQEQVHQYLSGDITKDMREIEHHYNYPLDDTYRQFIIEDIKKQVDQRILHYFQHMNRNINPEEMNSMLETITRQIHKDIRITMEAFIKNLPRKENNE